MSPRNLVIGVGALLVAVAAVVGVRSLLFPSRSLDTPRVVFVTGGAGPYWQLTARGAQDAAKEYDVDLTIEMPSDDESLVDQIQILSQLALGEINGVAVSPLDAEAQTRQIDVISEQAYVVTFDSDAPSSKRRCYVGTSNYDAGKMSAELCQEALSNGGKVAVLVANLAKDNNRQRQEGFQAKITPANEAGEPSRPAIEIVGYFLDDGDREECRRIIQQILVDHPDLAGFVAMNGYHGPILLEVLKEEGKLNSIQLVCFDEADETLVGIAEGYVYATVAQDPYNYGYEAVRILEQLSRGKPLVLRGSVTCDAIAVRRDNLDEFRTRLQRLLSKPTGDESALDAA